MEGMIELMCDFIRCVDVDWFSFDVRILILLMYIVRELLGQY